MKNKMFVVVLLVLVVSGAVVAFDQSPTPTSFIRDRTSSSSIQPFAVVGGGQCSASPDDAGCVRVDGSSECASYNLVDFTNGNVFCANEGTQTGCRVCFYNSAYKLISCQDMSSSSSKTAPSSSYYWERYDCFESACVELTEFQDVRCGDSYCNGDESKMLRQRQDSCGNVDKECISSEACRIEECEYGVGLWSGCTAGVQSRTVTSAGCDATTETRECGGIGEDLSLLVPDEVKEVFSGNSVSGGTGTMSSQSNSGKVFPAASVLLGVVVALLLILVLRLK